MRLRNRLKALDRALRPRHSGLYTLEEVCRAIWRHDPGEFRRLAECSGVAPFIRRFEREDEERRSNETPQARKSADRRES